MLTNKYKKKNLVLIEMALLYEHRNEFEGHGDYELNFERCPRAKKLGNRKWIKLTSLREWMDLLRIEWKEEFLIKDRNTLIFQMDVEIQQGLWTIKCEDGNCVELHCFTSQHCYVFQMNTS